MEYNMLGHSEFRVSEIGFGAMSIKQGNEDADHVAGAAIDAGINLFDTADLYERGWNESFIGRILQPKRKNIYIATKVGNQWNAEGTSWRWNPRKEYIIKAVEKALRG